MELPPCGRACEFCEAYKKACAGCVESKGKPFFLSKMEIDVCPIWKCASDKGLEHCGECSSFPCNRFMSWYDPRHGRASVLPYIGLLIVRKKLGKEKWRELADVFYKEIRSKLKEK